MQSLCRTISLTRSVRHEAAALAQGDVIAPAMRLSPALRFRDFPRPAIFGAFGQVHIICSDIEHLFFGDGSGHVLRHSSPFLRTVVLVLLIIRMRLSICR